MPVRRVVPPVLVLLLSAASHAGPPVVDEHLKVDQFGYPPSVTKIAVISDPQVGYNAPDPFASKVVLDRGARQGVEAGLAVIDADGVIGQITRVYPVQSEVTLLTDRNQAIPVLVERSGVRGVLFGTGQGGLEMRFLLADADVQPGDRIVTSGLDGVLVPGLPVATVSTVDRDSDAFARILCKPLAGVESSMQVLVIGREQAGPPRPAPADLVAPLPPAPPKKD